MGNNGDLVVTVCENGYTIHQHGVMGSLGRTYVATSPKDLAEIVQYWAESGEASECAS